MVAGLLLFVAATAFAQDTSPSPPEGTSSSTPQPANDNSASAEAERVIVTGSHIPTAAEVGPNPVQIIDRGTIDQSGERTMEELLRNLPVANANGVPSSGNGGAIGQGASSISLRGFDPGATLVLIDGHRMVSHPSGTTGGIEFFVDLNSIPRAAIASIEILKDGASTTYGADAIAGVVNIKLRRDYDGAESSVEYGNTFNKDSSEFAASLLFGVGKGDTNISGVVNYYHRNAIFSRDRDYDREVPPARTSLNASPYNLQVTRAAAEAAAGRPITEVPSVDANGNAINTFFAHAPFFTNGNAPASDYVFTEAPVVTFPFLRYEGEFPETERYGTFLSADHKVFGDQMVAYADVFYQRADLLNEQSPAATGPFEQPVVKVLAIPPHSPGATLGGPTYAETGVPVGAYNPFNPFQQIISGGTMARLFDFGNRKFDTRTDAFFTTAGLRGDKLFDGTWGYDAAFRYSRIESTLGFTFPSITRFNRAVNAADPIFDPSSPQYIGTTIPFNPFGDYRRSISNNAKLVDFVRIHASELDIGTLATVDVNIYTTELVKLPAGGVGLAFGGQFQHEAFSQSPDKFQLTGDLAGSFTYFAVGGNRSDYAGYGEISIPVFGGDFTAPGLHALEFTAAVRFEEFLNNGSNVTVPKFGMRWQPFDDSFTVRATWGEGFKQPTLAELFAPTFGGSMDVFDPVKGKFVQGVAFTFVPNPSLQPEDSRDFSGGIVYTPKFLPGLTITVDLFDIETTGRINAFPNPTETLARVANGTSVPGESATRDANGNLLAYSQTFVNSGTQKARGADFGVQYQLQTRWGTLTSLTQVTFLDSFQVAPTPAETERELRSSPVDPFSEDAYLKWKGSSRLDWAWHGFDLALTANYRDGFHEILALDPSFPDGKNEHWVKQTWFFDLQASYDFTPLSRMEETPVAGYSKTAAETGRGNDGKSMESAAAQTANAGLPFWRKGCKGLSLTVGCTDLFDHDPPSSIDNFPRFVYDPTGRFFYVSVTKKF